MLICLDVCHINTILQIHLGNIHTSAHIRFFIRSLTPPPDWTGSWFRPEKKNIIFVFFLAGGKNLALFLHSPGRRYLCPLLGGSRADPPLGGLKRTLAHTPGRRFGPPAPDRTVMLWDLAAYIDVLTFKVYPLHRHQHLWWPLRQSFPCYSQVLLTSSNGCGCFLIFKYLRHLVLLTIIFCADFIARFLFLLNFLK